MKQRIWLSLPGLKQAISVFFVLCLLFVATLSLAPSASASSSQAGGVGKRCQIVLDKLQPGERSSQVLSSQCVEGDQALVAPLGRTILMTWYRDINYGGGSTDVYGWDGPCDWIGYGFEYVGAFWDDTITSFKLYNNCFYTRAYTNRGYQGTCQEYYYDNISYVGSLMNDKISSFRIASDLHYC